MSEKSMKMNTLIQCNLICTSYYKLAFKVSTVKADIAVNSSSIVPCSFVCLISQPRLSACSKGAIIVVPHKHIGGLEL